MTTPPRNPLAQRLRDARGTMLNKDLAEALGWAPPRVSKIESGRQLPTVADLEAWAAATGVGAGALEQWKSMLEQISAERLSFAEEMRSGPQALQREYTAMAARCTDFRFYEKLVIPRFLQTPGYTQGLAEYNYAKYRPEVPIDSDQARREIADGVAQRQASTLYLYETHRQFRMLLDEAVLRTWRFSPEIMQVQLMRLQSVIGLSNVWLGILPLNRFVTEVGNNSFDIYGDQVWVETVLGEDVRVRSEEVEAYRAEFDRLATEAVTGTEAHQLIEDIRRTLPT